MSGEVLQDSPKEISEGSPGEFSVEIPGRIPVRTWWYLWRNSKKHFLKYLEIPERILGGISSRIRKRDFLEKNPKKNSERISERIPVENS